MAKIEEQAHEVAEEWHLLACPVCGEPITATVVAEVALTEASVVDGGTLLTRVPKVVMQASAKIRRLVVCHECKGEQDEQPATS